jgi:hypothetical protein
MAEQAKALQLADCLTRGDSGYSLQAAAELRRQHAEIERLTKFCDDLICELSGLRMAASMQKKIDELKASPSAQGQWVGLTDEEAMQTWEGVIKYAPGEVRLKDFARLIEGKLKEKNT